MSPLHAHLSPGTSSSNTMSAWVRCCLFSAAKGCISPHRSSCFPCVPRRSRMAWRTARSLGCVQRSKRPLFPPIRMIRLPLDVLRKNKPLALLSDVLPYGKFKLQQEVMVLNHCRQGLATAIFSESSVKNRFSLPNFTFFQFSFSTAPHPHYFSLNSQHCFLSTPLTRLGFYCTSAFFTPQPATKRTEPFTFCLALEEKNPAH